ncbi:MAG TPA: hypothetical protein DCP32_04380 [Anaerolineaceae bacterium]|nr:MAG: hypothetical protein A2X24_03345 [Chloroflexi bacterium GWB2_54_36]HAL16002.1 hypothetical protein [Anaerolineaceae bacterium]
MEPPPISTDISTSTILPSQTPTPLASIEQPVPTLISTFTRTPLTTLEPKEAAEAIRVLLQESVDCAAPCFWGITPGQTTLEEAGDIFSHFGLPMSSTTFNGKDYSDTRYEFDNGLSIGVTLTIQKGLVDNIRIIIIPEKQKVGTRREWLAYSPETLIKRYGPPTRVGLAADWGPGPFFSMQMYYEPLDLIVEYAGDSIIPAQRGTSVVCPLAVQFDSVRLWLGENPAYPPGPDVPLDEVTPLSVDEFSQLMIGDLDDACFMFDGNAY